MIVSVRCAHLFRLASQWSEVWLHDGMMLLPVSAICKLLNMLLVSYLQIITYMQTLRGKMWRTFLGLEAVKQEGYYEQLVYQALGNKYSKRKVRVGVCILNSTASEHAT